MMKRRDLMILIGSAAVSARLDARAQQPTRVWRVGVLAPGHPDGPPSSLPARVVTAFRAGLRDLGYVEGQNLSLYVRRDEGRAEKSIAQASELVRLGIDVLIAGTTNSTLAAKAVTHTVPIVMAASGGGDPVELGLAVSLGRPGGNITGLSLLTHALVSKRLELVKEAVPSVSRVGLLTLPGVRIQPNENAATARSLGISLQIYEVRGIEDFEAAFNAASRAKSEALVMVNSAVFAAHASRLAQLALKHGLATVSGETGFAQLGGLMDYGPNIAESWRRAAVYVDKILKGAKPAELPIEQPTRFELVINLKTAKALGIIIPESVLLRADELIE